MTKTVPVNATFLTPVMMGTLQLPNRVIMAPLTRNRALPDGCPGPLSGEYYTQRASAGLIITEATQISPMGKGYINTPGIYSDSHVQGWKQITDAVRAKGGRMFLQLWHVGRISHTSLLPGHAQPLAPSAIPAKAQTFTAEGPAPTSQPLAMTAEQIAATIADYRHAAACAKAAGFDGVEVHAANGYLIDQFLQDTTNQRTDGYGGSIEARMRFLHEVIAAVTDVFESGRVGVRLSPTGTFNDMGDSDPETHFGAVIDSLNPLSLAYLHIVESFPGQQTPPEQRALTQRLRERWNGFYIANGGYLREDGLNVLATGYAQAVCYGRPFISNPDLVRRLEENLPLNPLDGSTLYGGGAKGYVDYPFYSG